MLEKLTSISSTSLFGRIARLPLRLIPDGIPMPIITGPLRGKKWITGAYIHRCWIGTYEQDMQQIIAREVLSGSVFYDVGANAGYYSLLASSRVGNGQVLSFEPLPSNVLVLRRHLELNRVKNVRVFELAISDEVGTAHFKSEQTRGMGMLDAGGDISVRVASLDSLLVSGAVPPPDAIKMDIEGAEWRALLGARYCFEKYRPKLFLATHGQQVHQECLALLHSWKYRFQYIGKLEEPDRAEIYALPLRD